MIKRRNTSAPVPAPSPVVAAAIGEHRSAWSRFHPFTLGFFIALGALLAIALGAALTSLSSVLVYIGFAIFAALGLDPAVRSLMRRGLKRAWAIVVVCIAFAGVLAGAVLLVVPTVVDQIAQLVRNVPNLVEDFEESDLYAWVGDTFGTNISNVADQAIAFFSDPTNLASIGGGVLQFGSTLVNGVSGVVVVLVLTLYFLASMPSLKRAFVRMAPARNRPRVGDLTEQITNSVGGYLVGMVILAAINAVVACVLFLILGLPFAALLTVVAFLVTLIPLVGSVLFLVIASVLALFTDPIAALIFAGVYLVYIQLEAYLLTPRIMNRTISIPGSLVVIGALVGGNLLGLLGALIAIPVTASILLIYKQVFIPRQDAKI